MLVFFPYTKSIETLYVVAWAWDFVRRCVFHCRQGRCAADFLASQPVIVCRTTSEVGCSINSAMISTSARFAYPQLVHSHLKLTLRCRAPTDHVHMSFSCFFFSFSLVPFFCLPCLFYRFLCSFSFFPFFLDFLLSCTVFMSSLSLASFLLLHGWFATHRNRTGTERSFEV